MRQKKLTSFDGTLIAYQVSSPKNRKTKTPPIVLVNGLGGSYLAWSDLIKKLAKNYPLLSWDYRGLFRSGSVANPEHLNVEDHAKDLLEIFCKEKISRAILCGWSMGVQVSLEFYRMHPENVAGLILLNGVSGNTVERAFPFPGSSFLLPGFTRVLREFSGEVSRVTRIFLNWEYSTTVLSQVGFAKRNLNEFNKMLQEFKEIDFDAFFKILEQLNKHSADDVLPSISVPALVIAGRADLIAPYEEVKAMSRSIPDARFVAIPGGTHYSLLEYPDLVSRAMEKFLKKHFYKEMKGERD